MSFYNKLICNEDTATPQTSSIHNPLETSRRALAIQPARPLLQGLARRYGAMPAAIDLLRINLTLIHIFAKPLVAPSILSIKHCH
jgi:hypothetical protein